MPASSTLGRIGRVDFFAVLPAGFYIFLVAYLVGRPYVADAGERSFWSEILPLAEAAQQNPAILIFALFGSYLAGSILRSFPVYWAESAFRPFSPSRFPYPALICEVLTELASGRSGITLADERFLGGKFSNVAESKGLR